MLDQLRSDLQGFNVFLTRLFGLFLIYFWFYCLHEFFLSYGNRLMRITEYGWLGRGSWTERLFLSMFDIFAATNFFKTLLLVVIPFTLVGIWLGYSRARRVWVSEILIPTIPSALSVLPPIIFMLYCTVSSLHLIFLWPTVKGMVSGRLGEILLSARRGWGHLSDQNSLISQLDIAGCRIGASHLPWNSTCVDAVLALVSNGGSSDLRDQIHLYYRPSLNPINFDLLPSGFDGTSGIFSTFIENLATKITFDVEQEIMKSLITVQAGEGSWWLRSKNFTVDWSFIFDNLTIAIFFVVSSITFLVILFAYFYIAGDERRPVFFLLLTVFAGFIIFLVTSSNYLTLFIGWEGVGLSSFLLINFWYTRLQANKAAAKAVMVNRVGDVFLITALALIYVSVSSFDFNLVIARLLTVAGNDSTVELICLFLFLAAVGKSAQFGLHTWLPDAIEGPTPVSALLHAATIVTAGVYLIIRSSPLFSQAPLVSLLILIVGLLTAFFAATTALVQYDSKKVVAYSTCSQLGYMIFIAGLGQYNVSFFHLFNHAFFKALLFIAAGSVIHALGVEQDIRRIGGLGNSLTFVFAANFIGVVSLSGSLFISGFYSKDLILETGASSFTVSGLFLYWLGLIVAVFTGIYSSDILDDIFIEEPGEASNRALSSLHSTTYLEIFIMAVLALISIFSGYLFRDMFVGAGSPFFHWTALDMSFTSGVVYGVNSSYGFTVFAAEALPLSIKLLPFICSIVVGFQLSRTESTVYPVVDCVRFLSQKWYFDALQNMYVVYGFIRLGYVTFWAWDKFIFEQLRPLKLATLFGIFPYRLVVRRPIVLKFDRWWLARLRGKFVDEPQPLITIASGNKVRR